MESARVRWKTKSIGFLVDPSAKGFSHGFEKDSYPIEAFNREEVKLKSISICLHWASNGGPSDPLLPAEVGRKALKGFVLQGPTR